MPKETKTPNNTKTRPSSHHDIFFKEGFSDPCMAQELFWMGLTEEEFSAFDWDTLTSEKDTFQGSRADLVFSIALKNDPDKKVKIHLLLEHKSKYSYAFYGQALKYETGIILKSLAETGQATPVFAFVFHHGLKPWPGDRSLKKGLWGKILSKIPFTLQKDMLDCGLRVIDIHDPKVERAIRDKKIKSRGFLNLLKQNWTLKPDEEEIKKALFLFDNWPGDRDSLIVKVGRYIWSAVKGMTPDLWKKLEHSAVQKGIFTKGGFMYTVEHIKEEGRQEGRQEGVQQVIFNMLKKKLDFSLISEVTGLSEGEIKKLQNEK